MTNVFTVLVGAIANCIGPENCKKCEYRDIRTKTRCKTMLLRDALELLKAQEPVPSGKRIKAGDVMLDFYECGHCKNAIRKPWRYCPFCGKEVKWNG